MSMTYRTRRRLSRIGTVLLALLLLFVVVWFCWVVWIERYVVYTRDGAELDLELSANEMVGEVAQAPVVDENSVSIYFNEGDNAIDTTNALKQLNGYYIDSNQLTSNIAGVWDMLDYLPSGTPVMIDLKGGYGSFYYSSTLSGALTSQSVSVASVDELISEMKSRGFYVIARVSALRDYNYGLNHVEQGLYMLSRAGLWADSGGCYWLDPTNAGVLSWISSIVNELRDRGINEVVLTDFCFPDSDKYIFDGDKDAALQSAAATLMKNCATTSSFTLSFSVNSAAFPLQEGRSRIYLENVEPGSIGAKVAQTEMEEPEIYLVFIAATNDTRYDQYGILRPITVADVLEAQKGNAKTTKSTTSTTATESESSAASE